MIDPGRTGRLGRFIEESHAGLRACVPFRIEESTMKEISSRNDGSSRRTFLKSTGAVTAGLALTGYGASAQNTVAADLRTDRQQGDGR